MYYNQIFVNKKSQYLKWTIISAIILLLSSCSKGGGGNSTPPPTPEAQITFTMNPDPTGGIFAALGASQDFTINVTSKLPTGGVKVDLKLIKDLDGSSVFSQSITSTIAGFTVSYSNLTSGIVCSGTITIISASNATNSATKTFKIVKK